MDRPLENMVLSLQTKNNPPFVLSNYLVAMVQSRYMDFLANYEFIHVDPKYVKKSFQFCFS